VPNSACNIINKTKIKSPETVNVDNELNKTNGPTGPFAAQGADKAASLTTNPVGPTSQPQSASSEDFQAQTHIAIRAFMAALSEEDLEALLHSKRSDGLNSADLTRDAESDASAGATSTDSGQGDGSDETSDTDDENHKAKRKPKTSSSKPASAGGTKKPASSSSSSSKPTPSVRITSAPKSATIGQQPHRTIGDAKKMVKFTLTNGGDEAGLPDTRHTNGLPGSRNSSH
jgi:hypothetical protein